MGRVALLQLSWLSPVSFSLMVIPVQEPTPLPFGMSALTAAEGLRSKSAAVQGGLVPSGPAGTAPRLAVTLFTCTGLALGLSKLPEIVTGAPPGVSPSTIVVWWTVRPCWLPPPVLASPVPVPMPVQNAYAITLVVMTSANPMEIMVVLRENLRTALPFNRACWKMRCRSAAEVRDRARGGVRLLALSFPCAMGDSRGGSPDACPVHPGCGTCGNTVRPASRQPGSTNRRRAWEAGSRGLRP